MLPDKTDNQDKKIYVAIKSIISTITLREKCPYLELFWSVFSLIQTAFSVFMR